MSNYTQYQKIGSEQPNLIKSIEYRSQSISKKVALFQKKVCFVILSLESTPALYVK